MYFDTSKELMVLPYHNGVKLSKSLKEIPSQTLLTIEDVLNFPCNVYFLNTDSAILNINQHSAKLCGFESIHDAIGKSVFDVLHRDSAQSITNVDKYVASNRCTKIHDDLMIRSDSYTEEYLTIKSPVYNENDQIIGIFGCSIAINKQPLAESLSVITDLNLLKSPGMQNKNGVISHAGDHINGIYYSYREIQILNYSSKGRTAREIATILKLSHRTVENYLSRIKDKLGASKKSHMIEMFNEYKSCIQYTEDLL